MDDKTLNGKIDEYLAQNWDQMVADIDTLVQIPSVEDLGRANAQAGSPFGPEPARALDAALGIADRMGLVTKNCDGYMGIADFPGESDTQLGIIGHVDVVNAGPGWHFEPYQVTRKDGYLLGRGTSDDKGPIVTALHAVNFWKRLVDAGDTAPLPYTVRVLFGANEETSMGDVAYYRAHYADPAFLFTPDAEFPVCYGEMGICSGVLKSKPIADGNIIHMEGGAAVNAVPGQAYAVVRYDGRKLPRADRIALTNNHDGTWRIDAEGKSAHASTPDLGVNAIAVLVSYLLRNNLVSYPEKQYLLLDWALLRATDGSGLNIHAEDDAFGRLTAVGGIVFYDRETQPFFTQTVDCRYPTTTSSAEIAEKVNEMAQVIGAEFAIDHDKVPFLMDRDSPAVQALLEAYNEATGEDAQAFTMAGGTYARMFSNAASFGPDKPWAKKPSWVGSMHGPDEGILEDLLKQAFRIYVLTIGKLMRIAW